MTYGSYLGVLFSNWSSLVIEPMKFRTIVFEGESLFGYGSSKNKVIALGATTHEYPVLHSILKTDPNGNFRRTS
jgi:hypothetical protein